MTRRIIIFLIRKRLGLRTYECFRFKNQLSNKVVYCFGKTELKKIKGYSPDMDWSIPRLKFKERIRVYTSDCALSWLLSEHCEIEKMGFDAPCVE